MSWERWISNLVYALQLYYIPILVNLGTIGNCLSVCVFFGSKLRKTSSSFYLGALAICDTGFLISLFVTWMELMGYTALFNRAGFCQFFIYLSTLCSFLSVWLVVAFTVERFVAVRYPLRRKSMCTVVRAKMIIGGVTCVGCILCTPMLWFTSSDDYNNNKCSSVTSEQLEYWLTIFNIFDMLVTFVVPFTIIVLLNASITRVIWRFNDARRTLTTSSCASMETCSGYNTKVTKMLLLVSTVFLCFNLPSYIIRLHNILSEKRKHPTASMVQIQHLCNLLFDTNFGINFALYCLSGRNFRSALAEIFHCADGQQQRNTRGSQMSTQVTNICLTDSTRSKGQYAV